MLPDVVKWKFFRCSRLATAFISLVLCYLRGMKRILCFFVVSIVLQDVFSQSLDSLFVNAPSEVLPTLERGNRLNMLDFYASGMEAKVDGSLGGSFTLLSKNDSVLRMSCSDEYVIEMRWFSDRGRILLLKSVKLPEVQSFAELFDARWARQELAVPEYEIGDFLTVGAKEVQEDVRQRIVTALTPCHYGLSWDSARCMLRVQPSLERLAHEDRVAAEMCTDGLFLKIF